MKKKLYIVVLFVLLFSLPLFAFGSKESKKNKTSDVQTAPVSTPISTPVSTPASSSVSTDEITTTPADSSTSIATPLYKVQLTEAEYITEEDLNDAKAALQEYYGSEITDEDALDYLVNQILLNQALVRALDNGDIPLYDGQFNDYVSYQLALFASYYNITLSSNEEAEEFLSLLGITFEDFANSVLQDYAQEYYISLNSNGRLESVEVPTDAEIKAFYDANLSYFVSDEAVRLAHIYFAFGSDKETAKVKADTALNNIQKGLSFEDAVSTYSEDNNTSQNKGDFGVWIESSNSGAIDSFGANAMKEIFKLKVGQVSEVVEGVQGYHIFKILDHVDASLLSLTDLYDLNSDYTVSDVIAQELYSQKQSIVYSEILDEIFASLREEAEIKSLR